MGTLTRHRYNGGIMSSWRTMVESKKASSLSTLRAFCKLVAMFAWAALLAVAAACASGEGQKSPNNAQDIGGYPILDARQAPGSAGAAPDLRTVTFAAVGDNLIHKTVYLTHAKGDGTYDFNDVYAPTKPYVEEVDFAFINQETVCGGTGLGLSDYPSFNSPHEILDAVASAGFDWVNTASNHVLDAGEQGILSQLDHIKNLPTLVQTGTHASAEDAGKPTVVVVNDVRLGLASYTYGLNGYETPNGKEYLVDLIDRGRIERDMKALNAVSDVQLVSMHWGV
ncbi:MAG: CapA family protein, partial [Coriobacteriaceae bacterium]|nr:CapA family protein [Coriobacteriaceae bacterium]